ncbi:hypothetical protein CDAR_188301 [Caerostris darwini]|uniref:Uncharacterized protein n=1 Tax=Caerostris darwini TaxID=1538125 RepID=A0AAV4T1F5_9ARAC|nr:hypothetical protein CDAR_188301 [Caerostris darwini]
MFQEFKDKDDLSKQFQIVKATARNPHIICFDLSPDNKKAFIDCLRNQFLEEDEQIENDFKTRHRYSSKRGINWIIELNPMLFPRTRKLNLGWERISFQPINEE